VELVTEFDQAYFDRMAALEAVHPWTASMRLLTLELLAAQGVGQGCRVLDAGCGTGLFLRDFAERFRPALAAGVEYYLPPLLFAGRRSEAALVAGSADKLPLRGDWFDVVHSADVLQHMEIAGAHTAIAEFHRVLKAGGVVALRLRATRRLIPNPPDADMNHSYTCESLRRRLESIGFELVFLRRVNVIPSFVEELRRRRVPSHADEAPVKGIALREESDLRAKLLRAYLSLERAWLRSGLPTPEYGHTILAIARKR